MLENSHKSTFQQFNPLLAGSLTSFSPDHFTNILHTLSLVWFRFAQATDLCRYLSNQLLIGSFQKNCWVLSLFLGCCQLQFFRNFENDIVRISQRKIQEITLVRSFITYTNQFEVLLVSIRYTLHKVGN